MSAKLALGGEVIPRSEVGLSPDGAALEMVEPSHPDGTPASRYPDLPSFVAEFIATTWIRETGGVHWCASWWRHREAQVRLEALWRTYEAVRTEATPAAMTGFLRVELDHHMAVLTSADGPFWACDHRQNKHKPQRTWPVEDPPAGLFLPDPPPAA